MSVVLTIDNKTAPAPVRPHTETEQPDPAWVRGRCPECGSALVSHLYFVHGKGYLIRWECWASQGEAPTCEYKLVL